MAHSESRADILAVSGLNAKSITGLRVTTVGSLTIIEVKHSTGSGWIKTNQGAVEVGGTEDWDSGTKVNMAVVSGLDYGRRTTYRKCCRE